MRNPSISVVYGSSMDIMDIVINWEVLFMVVELGWIEL